MSNFGRDDSTMDRNRNCISPIPASIQNSVDWPNEIVEPPRKDTIIIRNATPKEGIMMPNIMKNMTIGLSFCPYALSSRVCSFETWLRDASSARDTSEPDASEFAICMTTRLKYCEGLEW